MGRRRIRDSVPQSETRRGGAPHGGDRGGGGGGGRVGGGGRNICFFVPKIKTPTWRRAAWRRSRGGCANSGYAASVSCRSRLAGARQIPRTVRCAKRWTKRTAICTRSSGRARKGRREGHRDKAPDARGQAGGLLYLTKITGMGVPTAVPLLGMPLTVRTSAAGLVV